MIAILAAPAGKTFELERMSVEYHRFKAGTRHPMFAPHEPLKERIALATDFRLWWEFHFHSTVHGETTEQQFRGVGWAFELFVRPLPWVETGVRHHSRHNLDQPTVSPGRFPVEDSWFVRLNLVQ